MIKALLGFEARYYSRQLLFWIAALVFLALGMAMVQGEFGGPEVYKNSPYANTSIFGILSLLAIFVTTLFSTAFVLRDHNSRMDALVFSTRITRLQYFSIRFAGLLLSVVFLFVLMAAGLILGMGLVAPERSGPFRLWFYLQPLLVMAVPNALFCCSIVFAVSLVTRSTRAVYATGVLIFMLYMTVSILGQSPLMARSTLPYSNDRLWHFLIDPFGITVFLTQTREWMPAQRNRDLFALHGPFLLNRLLWIAVSLLILTVSFIRFRFRSGQGYGRKQNKETIPPGRTIYRPVAADHNSWLYSFKVVYYHFLLHTKSLFRQIPFIVMLALWVFMYAIDLFESAFSGPYGIKFYANSGYIAEYLLSVKPALLLLVFYAGELINKEHSSRMEGLIYSTPAPPRLLWFAKAGALAALIMLLLTLHIATGIGVQMAAGSTAIEWLVYLSLYYYAGLPLLLFAILILFIQTLVRNVYVGMLLSLLLLGTILYGRMPGNLARYAVFPALSYRDMNGWGYYTSAFNWLMLYWLSCAAALAIFASSLWQGGVDTGLLKRWKNLFRQRPGRWALAFVIAVGCCTGLGFYIAHSGNQLSTARNSTNALNWRYEYEKKYKPLAALVQPVITAVKMETALYPEQGSYEVKGNYSYKNVSSHPLSELWLGIDPEIDSVKLIIPDATPITADHVFKQYRYKLKQPLEPGEVRNLQFIIKRLPNRFRPFNSEHAVVSNGSYVELEKYVPAFGYNQRLEIDDEALRKRWGLAPQGTVASVDSFYRLIDFESTLSTAADQHVVTAGILEKEWVANGRHYFHYRSPQPMSFMFAFSSARYAIKEEFYKERTFRVYYHPDHTSNTAIIMQALKDAIDYGDTHFSPYPLSQISLAEIPHYPGSATAYPGVLFSTEMFNFMADFRDSSLFNFAYATTAHEVAHQWWAQQLAPLPVAGRATLTESLAKYTEAAVVEKRFGPMYLRSYFKKDNEYYFAMRTGTDEELPLAHSNGQPFVAYQKGGLSFYMLKEMLGQDKFEAALRQLLRGHGTGHTKAVVDDFTRLLLEVASPEQQQFVRQTIEEVASYNNTVRIVSCRQQPDGRYQLQTELTVAQQNRVGKQQHPAGPLLWLPLTVWSVPDDEWKEETRPILQQWVFIDKKTTRITLITDHKPAVVSIDPYNYVLDEDLTDNIQKADTR